MPRKRPTHYRLLLQDRKSSRLQQWLQLVQRISREVYQWCINVGDNSNCVINVIIRCRNWVTDIDIRVAIIKWRWAGHVCRRREDQWNPKHGRLGNRGQDKELPLCPVLGRPPARLQGDIISATGRGWKMRTFNKSELSANKEGRYGMIMIILMMMI